MAAVAQSQAVRIPAWRALLETSMIACRPIRGSNYVQLATVQLGPAQARAAEPSLSLVLAMPRVRTVVFRGFLEPLPSQSATVDEGTDANVSINYRMTTMQFATDFRSEKVTEIQMNANAEVCWWIPSTKEQYRITGLIRPCLAAASQVGIDQYISGESDDEDREKLWQSMSPGARKTFLDDKRAPGMPFLDDDDDDVEIDVKVSAPDSFVLLKFEPSAVDYLNLKSNKRSISTYSNKRSISATTAATADEGGWTMKRINP
jgi:pyridoxamine 5'-phosphate oxidase